MCLRGSHSCGCLSPALDFCLLDKDNSTSSQISTKKPPTQHLDFFFFLRFGGPGQGYITFHTALHHLWTPPHSLSPLLEQPRFLVSWLTASQSFLKKFHLCVPSRFCLSPRTNAKTFFLQFQSEEIFWFYNKTLSLFMHIPEPVLVAGVGWGVLISSFIVST